MGTIRGGSGAVAATKDVDAVASSAYGTTAPSAMNGWAGGGRGDGWAPSDARCAFSCGIH
ncbi:hypothetical protein [Mycolicibacterium sp. lyk4-40-TYG-92]|uniref:hypothetical protein n=1 Tax=Mycolicibacterium sp. lyk4-40-TYG-92 TaxID=3040295 RepID=UPI00254C7C81|nr:hypothetical protein [Mycolicibacterium sp. lyk4-40-TYG-92]